MGYQHFLFGQAGTLKIRVSVQTNNKTITQVLAEISKNYRVKFYNQDTQQLNRVCLPWTFTNELVADVLSKLLKESGLSFLEYEPYLYIISGTDKLNTELFSEYFKKKSAIETNMDDIPIVVGSLATIQRSGVAHITGRVTDGVTDTSIRGVVIKISGVDTIVYSDQGGVFEIHVPIGIHTLMVESDLYQNVQLPIKVYSDGIVDIKLFENSLSLPELVVGGSAQRRLAQAQAGVAELSIKEIKRLPSLMGETDVLKALLTLPGVSNTGEVGSGYNVRGGNIDQNLILQEGAFHLNPSHVLGLFSAFNPDAIKSVTLYKGYIPAQYGGRTSSVLDIKLKDPNFEQWSVFGGVGPISSKIFIEGPLKKNRTSLFVGSRFTYSDWVLKLVRDPNLKSSRAGFYDFNFKIAHRFNSKSSIQFSSYASKDDFNYAKEFGYGWQTQSHVLSYTNQLKPNLLLTANVLYSDSRNDFEDQTAIVRNVLENGLVYYKTKWNLSWQASEKQTVNIGLDGIRYLPEPQNFRATFEQNITEEKIEQSRGDEAAIYINDEFSIGKKFNLAIGFRFNMYRNIGAEQVNQYLPGMARTKENLIQTVTYAKGETIKSYQGAEPRLSVAYVLTSNKSIKLAYNRLTQFIHLVSNTAAATPVDLWQLSNTHVQPQLADNLSLGYFNNLNNNEWETSLEVYFKQLDRLLEYKDFAKLLRNPSIETELFPVKGKSYGAEFSIKRSKNNPTGYISYTWSRSLRKSPGLFPDEIINNGNWYASNFDKPHNLNVVFDVQIRKTMFLSANFVYASGRPQTAPIADFYLGDGGVFLNYSQRNSLRIPDYHRLDVSFTVTRGAIRTSKNKGSLTLAVYNLYARKNAFSVFYRRTPNHPLVGYKLAVLGAALPSLTYNFQFSRK